MNKLLIGLLIVAAAGGAFFLLRKKNNAINNNDLHKEWIVGRWKLDTIQPSIDPEFHKYFYDFTKEGMIVQLSGDSARTDTSHYRWNEKNELLWSQSFSSKTKDADSSAMVFTVLKLSEDSLRLRLKDSLVFVLSRSK